MLSHCRPTRTLGGLPPPPPPPRTVRITGGRNPVPRTRALGVDAPLGLPDGYDRNASNHRAADTAAIDRRNAETWSRVKTNADARGQALQCSAAACGQSPQQPQKQRLSTVARFQPAAREARLRKRSNELNVRKMYLTNYWYAVGALSFSHVRLRLQNHSAVSSLGLRYKVILGCWVLCYLHLYPV